MVTGPVQGKSSGRTATFSLWTGMFRDGISSKGRQKNNSSRDEIYEKKSRIHLDRLQNKYTNYKGIKSNTNFGQITGIQEKLDTTCK